jgi:hypothetical protein
MDATQRNIHHKFVAKPVPFLQSICQDARSGNYVDCVGSLFSLPGNIG